MPATSGLFVRAEPAVETLARVVEFTDRIDIAKKSTSVRMALEGITYDDLNAARSFAATHPFVDVEQVSISFPVANQAVTWSYKKHDDLSSVIEIKNLRLLDKKVDDFLNALDDTFEIIPQSKIVHGALPDTIKQQLAFSQDALMELQRQTSRLGEYLAEAAIRNDEHIRKLSEEQQQHWQNQEAELQRRANERIAQLDNREEELGKRERKFDLREHRGVRRDTLERINEELDKQKSFAISSQTSRKGLLIHVFCYLAMAIGLALVVATAYSLLGSQGASTPNVNWQIVSGTSLYVPFASGMLVFGSTLVFYLRWLNSVFRQQANGEFQNLKFSKDILRASWIAELLLEAHNPSDEKQKPFDVPEFLLEHFSRGLFEFADESTSQHPIEDLQKYARQFKKLVVGPVQIETKEGPETR